MDTVTCPSCGADNPAASNYCTSCQAILASSAPEVSQPAASTDTCPSCGNSDTGGGRFCTWCAQFLAAPKGVANASPLRRLGAYVLDALLPLPTLFIGYLIWWLITLQWGQTPGKQLVGIRAMTVEGADLGWGPTFVREFLIKAILFALILGPMTGGIVYVLDLIWALWDTDRQTLHDKIMSTVVVDDRAYRATLPIA